MAINPNSKKCFKMCFSYTFFLVQSIGSLSVMGSGQCDKIVWNVDLRFFVETLPSPSVKSISQF